jgi:hypothetical protein
MADGLTFLGRFDAVRRCRRRTASLRIFVHDSFLRAHARLDRGL